MSNVKPTVPVEVARAIALLRKEDCTNFEIIKRAAGAITTEPDLVLRRWANGNYDELMRALIIGYEVEQTPEDKLAEAFRTHLEIKEFYEHKTLDISEWKQERFSSGYVGGIKDTLNILGISIEGINA